MPVTRKGGLERAQGRLENGLKRGLILSGKLVAQRAAGLAPVLTGRLKRSIVEGMPYMTGQRVWTIDVGSNVEYAKIQEFGGQIEGRTSATGTKWKTAYIRAQPYLRPALDQSKDDVKRLLLRSVIGAIKNG